MKLLIAVLITGLLAGCASTATPTTVPRIYINATSSTQPWLTDMYPCAQTAGAVLVVDNPAVADVLLRIAIPDKLSTPSFQLGEDDVLVVAQPQTGVGELTVDQVRAIYSGQVTNWNEVGGLDLPVEVWTYPQGEDIRQIFEQSVMDGLRTIPSARVAASAQMMSDNVGTNPGAIGFLPRRWKTGNTHEVVKLATSPVLAITKTSPGDVLEKVLACAQK